MKKYEELVKIFKQKIPLLLKEGCQALPSEAEICLTYQVSRQTVRKAYTILAQEKLIESRRGSGTYLTGLLPDQGNNQVALLLTTDTEYIYPELLSDIGRPLSGAGFSVSVHTTGDSVQAERSLLLRLLKHPPRGLIAEGCHNALPTPNADLYQELEQRGTSILFLYGRYPNVFTGICIEDDNFQGGYELTQHLLRKGQRHIAGIFQSDTVQGRDRYLGYVTALRDYDAPLPSDNLLWFDDRMLQNLQKKQDTRFLREYISKNLLSCTACVCYNDELAYWLIRELTRMKIAVPKDLSVVGFDNSYLRHASHLQLTTLAHEAHAVGKAASSCLLQMMQGRTVLSQTIPWTLLPGNSDRSL
ncbi:MAG: GntR family transcriptional regulator [Eubacteriales bacterium]|nr:GntR family transcriptional regulator [Eubacteriales bacterium]